MGSDESDDEPLSILAASKKEEPEKFQQDSPAENEPDSSENYEPKRKRKKKIVRSSNSKKLAVTIKLKKLKSALVNAVIERPHDVWLYLKDLTITGPYSCLMCSELFISRGKLVVHYILNHKKDFCGICRYFVPDRETWWRHQKFHTPWPCSQCIQNFETETELRKHLSSTHKLVHCRLCHFRLSDDDQYNTHLYQKHTVTNVSSKDEEFLWELEYDGDSTFLCLLCSKSNNMSSTFFNHYMGFHHFTLKCFASLISGKDPPFLVYGAEISAGFIEQLKGYTRLGYVDINKQKDLENASLEHEGDSRTEEQANLILMPEIKQEALSDFEDESKDFNVGPNELPSVISTYKGEEDFDLTQMELILLEKCYFDYVNGTLTDVNSNTMPIKSSIEYECTKDVDIDVICPLCKTKHTKVDQFTNHIGKMHAVKIVPVYSCRVCATTFETQNELETHGVEELKEFDDLWLCQFCDREFDNRESTRRHLTDHWDSIEDDNCFSPHLGFKCKYCPMLFWNEIEREVHQVDVHFSKYKDQYYKCECQEVFSDKVWFIHHYMDRHCAEDTTLPSYLLKCCICCIVMTEVDGLRMHFESMHPEARKIFCSLDACLYKPLSHRKSFNMHLRTVHNPSARSERTVSCPTCGRQFNSQRACSTHITQAHGPGKYKCNICREMLHTVDERKLHYLIHHPGQHPFQCVDCGKSFQYKSSLYMHRQEHQPNKQDFTCTYCSKVFTKKDSFREHLQIHEGPRHACSYCPMRFVQRSNMLRHERRHTGERPYACPHCSRTFADKGACNSHTRTHSKERSYNCIYCGQTFAQKSKLTYHIRKHTGENLETCSVCSKLFTSACALREHMKCHTIKKQTIKCPLCDKKYQDERYMLRHLRTSHTTAQVSCPLCSKVLTNNEGLKHHVLTHSKSNIFQCKFCTKSYAVKRSILKHLRKRHSTKITEVTIKDFYKRLDPRECGLGLDEEVMNSIFGPPKKTVNDILLGNFVTLAKNFTFLQKPAAEERNENVDTNHEESEVDSGDDDDGQDKDCTAQEGSTKIKEENKSDGEVELEPTDFVSVKIEPLGDEDEELN